jgi:DNA-binding SARP family transcriptional activator/tetratricopeptide (TPR) repeat protein
MTDAPSLLTVTTLGRFAVSRDQQEFSGGNWNRRKVCALFKLLVSAEQHRLHREQIQEILWPSSTSEQAANSFGKTLYLLRRALEPELASGKGNLSTYISLTHDAAILVPEHIQIDADLFEASVKELQARLHAQKDRDQDGQILDEFDYVLHLFCGDYLPEDLYEDWAQKRRDRLRRLHRWLLEHAATLAVAHTMGLRACEYLQTLLEQDVTDEQTHRLLMLVYARMGHRTDALNQFQQLKTVLRTELKASPLPETVTLFRDIQNGRIPQDLALSQYVFGGYVSSPPVIKHNRERVPSQMDMQKGTSPIPQQGVSPFPASDQIGKKPQYDVGKQHATEGAFAQEGRSANRNVADHIVAQTPLVGREEEIERLQDLYVQSRQGQQHVCIISGEPGIGKTRLASDFTAWAKETQQAQVLWGHCYEMSTALPYQPIVDVIKTLTRSQTPQQLSLLLGSHASDLVKIVPEIRAKLPNLPCPEQGEPGIERYNLYCAVAHYFGVLATEQPLVIVLDDVQWADTATFQLLSYLINRVHYLTEDLSPALFFVLLYRANEIHVQHPLQELRSTLSRLGHLQEIHLDRFDEEAVQQLVADATGSSPSSLFTDQIYKHTEGNPFFVGQILLSLIQEGKVEKSGGQITTDLDKLTLPPSVRLLIERRLAHLSADCRTMLMVAAILGRQFNSVLLCEACHLAEEVIAQQVDDVIQLHILLPLPEQTPEAGQTTVHCSADLTFTHDKIREVLYQGLNPLRCRTLHRQVAQAIEALYSPHLTAYYGTLALHYKMAEEYKKAIDYYQKAFGQACSVYAFHDAASYMENVLVLLVGSDERPQRAEILHRLASSIYLYLGLTDKSIEAGLAACALWRDLGNPVREAEARLDVAFAFHWQGQERQALVSVKQALECLELQDETRLRAKAYSQWAVSAIVRGETSEALEQVQHAEELRAQMGGSEPFVDVLTLWSRSWHAFLTGTIHEMFIYAQRGAEICRVERRAGWEPMLAYTVAWAYMLKGNLVEGERIAQETLEKAQKNNAVAPQAWVFLVQTLLAIQSAQWQRAQECSDRALMLAHQLRDLDLQARVLWGRSILAGWLNDWELSIREITEAIQLSQQSDNLSLVYPHFLLQAAKAYMYVDQIDEAQRYLDQGMQLSQERGYRQLPALGKRLQGRICVAKGQYRLAQTYFEQSLKELASLEDIVEHARTLEAYGQWYLAAHHLEGQEEGHKLLAQSQKIFQQLGLNG